MIPMLTIKRLTLRAPEARDAAAYAAFYASERSAVIGGPKDATEAWRVLTNDVGHWHLRGYGWWALDDGDGCVGSCGFHLPEGRPEVELGWSLFRATGRGYATEAARAALDWARGTGHAARWGRIVSHIDRANLPSQSVAARLGARDTGLAPDHDSACTIWEHAA